MKPREKILPLPTRNAQRHVKWELRTFAHALSYSPLSGKRFPSVDFCMSGPSETPRAVPAHNPAKSGMWFSVSIGTYLTLMTNPCHKLSNHSEFVRYLRTILSSVHLTFLLSGTIPAIFFHPPNSKAGFPTAKSINPT